MIDFLPGEGGFINILAVSFIYCWTCIILASFFYSLNSNSLYLPRALSIFFILHTTRPPHRLNDGLTDFLVEISISIFCYLVNDLSFVSLSFNNSCVSVVFYLGRAYIPSSINRETNSLMVYKYIRFERNKNAELNEENKIIATTATAADRQKDRQTSTRTYISIHRTHRAKHSWELNETEHHAQSMCTRWVKVCSFQTNYNT